MKIMLEMKSQTAVCHAEVEQLLRDKLFTGTLSQDEYCDVITAFYQAYSSLEAAASRFPAAKKLLAVRSKIELLQKDLIYLTNNRKGHESDVFVSEPPVVPTEAVALGVLYVMEGSTLGGKIVNNYLMKYEWMNVDTHGNFFNSYGDKRSDMWTEFGRFLEQYATDNPSSSDQIIQGATLAFHYIHSLLRQVS